MRKAVGIDLGGTKISGALVNESGEVIRKSSMRTSSSGEPSLILDQLEKIARELSENEDVSGIGIGSPGFVDSDKGNILAVGGNIPGWAWTEVASQLSARFDSKVMIDNDANCAAECEAWLGAGSVHDSFVMLTIGTGLGGAIWFPKTGLWRGANYRAAEFGHSILWPGGRGCTCGQKGCAEGYISGSAIQKNYYDITGTETDGNTIVDSYWRDDSAKLAVDRFSEDLGIFLVTLRNILDPEAFIIGGGVSESREIWWDRMIESFMNRVNDATSVKILPAKYGNEAGMLGAAKIIFDASC